MAEWKDTAAEAAASEVAKLQSPSPKDIEVAIKNALDSAVPEQPAPATDVVTMTVNLRRDAVDALDVIAKAHSTDRTGALHQAIATELAAVRMKRSPLKKMLRS